MQGVSIGTVGTLEVIRGTNTDKGRVALRMWEGTPNHPDAEVVQDVELSADQAEAYLALLRLAVR
jgi:hypothetical protein